MRIPRPRSPNDDARPDISAMTLAVDIRTSLSKNFVLEANFTAPPGITILFGRSGSGKTTLLNCVAGLVRPDAGRIALDSRVLFDATAKIDLPPAQRAAGFLF